jgi:SagB-type dehydrogenase family enzyme
MRVRRSPHLVVHWRRGRLVATNYATRSASPIDSFVVQILDACEAWTSVRRLGSRLDVPPDASFHVLLDRLVGLHLLEQHGEPPDPRVSAMSSLAPWNPEAGFFHTASRDVAFATAREAARFARLQAERSPMPPVVKRYRAATIVELPKPRTDGEFPTVLRARRTWRRFSKAPIARSDLATLLGLTSGVQQWVTSAGQKLALKTSPSGGARHSIETYVVVRDVAQVKPGVYHYAPDRHALEKIRGPVSLKRLRDYLPNSGYFATASAMVFFTTIFERILWRYPYSRAYRAALVEAGHLCQTFCLTATWLGLAPYCVMGLADSLIERDLGIDGIRESVLYCAGVGRPPAGSSWAPLPRGTLQVRPNRSLSK